MARVILDKVHKNYGAPEDAVKGASFTVADGEFVVMLGNVTSWYVETSRWKRDLHRLGSKLISDKANPFEQVIHLVDP